MFDIHSEARPIDFATEGLLLAHQVGRNCGIGFILPLVFSGAIENHRIPIDACDIYDTARRS